MCIRGCALASSSRRDFDGAVIFVGGLLLGFARRQTGSVIVPILMHIAWNLYAVW